MKILIACEFSGITRGAFAAKGHDVMSCDLLPTEKLGKHYQGDVMDIINDGWDMMIAHPPCTYLSYVATRVWNKPGRKEKRDEAMEFFKALYNAPIEKICVENPLGEPMKWIPYDQLIHPYNFGEAEKKRTCLWLKNLPPLMFGAQVNPVPMYISNGKTTKGKKIWRTEGYTGKDRQKERFKQKSLFK